MTRGKLETDPHAASSVPIYQTATFDVRRQGDFDYTRSGNPTRAALEQHAAELEGANHAMAFTSGMAALAAVMRLVPGGGRVVACRDLYGGMHRLLSMGERQGVLSVDWVETWKLSEVEAALDAPGRPPVSLVCLESPTNPQMRVSDIRGISRAARASGALVMVDNSLMSPLLMRPLALGADVVVHSATKYFAGHSDVMAGLAAVDDEELASKLRFVQNAEGAGLAPFDAWLVQRGIKTMALRVKAAQRNAVQVYEALVNNPGVVAVNFLRPPGAAYLQVDATAEAEKRARGNPSWREEAELHYSQASGGGGVLSFEMDSVEAAREVVASCKLFRNAVSFGSTSSAIEIPAEMSHASIPAEEQTMSPALIRLALGIEDAGDLTHDLAQAIALANMRTTGSSVRLQRTLSQSLPLGESLPPQDAHAVGVSMPTWDDVVAYERGDAQVHSKLSSGYPRFVFLHAVKQLFHKAEALFAGPGETAMVFPSARVALRFQQYLGDPATQCHDLAAHGAFAVTFPAEQFARAKLFWQHTGEIPSSRLAAAILDVVDRTCYENSQGDAVAAAAAVDAENRAAADRTPDSGKTMLSHKRYAPYDALKKRIAGLAQHDASNVFLYPTGMAAVAATQRLLRLASQWEEKPLRTVVWGFPYLDTLKLAQLDVIGTGCAFFGRGDDADFAALEQLLERERISGLFLEFPSNPLLKAPQLRRLRALADAHGFPLIVDDTVAGMCNVDVGVPGGADIVITSLTKQFSGSGNVMGGSLMLNEHSSMYGLLRSRLTRDHEQLLFEEDAQVLLRSSADLEVRVARSNASAEAVVGHLASHPLVKTVYHPTLLDRELYDEFKRSQPYAGYGALLSVCFHDPAHSQVFFDHLDTAKGPGFGTNFSLTCPYTLIAHFNELKWAQDFGVDPSLVRIWIGQEDESALLAKLDYALARVPPA